MKIVISLVILVFGFLSAIPVASSYGFLAGLSCIVVSGLLVALLNK